MLARASGGLVNKQTFGLLCDIDALEALSLGLRGCRFRFSVRLRRSCFGRSGLLLCQRDLRLALGGSFLVRLGLRDRGLLTSRFLKACLVGLSCGSLGICFGRSFLCLYRAPLGVCGFTFMLGGRPSFLYSLRLRGPLAFGWCHPISGLCLREHLGRVPSDIWRIWKYCACESRSERTGHDVGDPFAVKILNFGVPFERKPGYPIPVLMVAVVVVRPVGPGGRNRKPIVASFGRVVFDCRSVLSAIGDLVLVDPRDVEPRQGN